MRFLLDTNTCIYLIKRSPEHVYERFKRMRVGDVGISAITFEGLTLVTNNVREFRRVPDLRIENWIDPEKPRPRGKSGL